MPNRSAGCLDRIKIPGENSLRILIDIGHPGHVHLFRNMIRIMQHQGHEFLITARDKEVTHELLNAYGIGYQGRGKGYKGIVGKACGVLSITAKIISVSRKFRPDIFVGGVGNLYVAIAGWIMRKPALIFDDTEHASLELAFVKRFASAIITPDIYEKDFGKKQVRYAGYHEWSYLHPNYFAPDRTIYRKLNIPEDKPYVVIRFVSWGAAHDMGQKGLTGNEKMKLVNSLSDRYKVFISAEGDLQNELRKFQLKLHPAEMHSVLAGASLFIGEGATMASESVCLGTPAIYVNSLSLGYCEEQKDRGLLYHLTDLKLITEKAMEILNNGDGKKEYMQRHRSLFKQKIDVTAFMVWFVENYPGSHSTMIETPRYQEKFLT